MVILSSIVRGSLLEQRCCWRARQCPAGSPHAASPAASLRLSLTLTLRSRTVSISLCSESDKEMAAFFGLLERCWCSADAVNEPCGEGSDIWVTRFHVLWVSRMSCGFSTSAGGNQVPFLIGRNFGLHAMQKKARTSSPVSVINSSDLKAEHAHVLCSWECANTD